MTNLEQEIARILIEKKIVLSIAESCTGGLISSRLTDVSGSSAYTKQNFVTYSNEAKQKYLDVKKETLDKYGAVSEETVKEMVSGILKNTDANLALAISGIAGPNSDETNKPVGLVYFSVANKNTTATKKFLAQKKYERTKMKKLFSDEALNFLLKFLNSMY